MVIEIIHTLANLQIEFVLQFRDLETRGKQPWSP